MSYSYDLRKHVEAYVLGGGKKTEAAQLFRVHVQTIHNWMRMKGGVCSAGKPGPKTGRTVKCVPTECARDSENLVRSVAGAETASLVRESV